MAVRGGIKNERIFQRFLVVVSFGVIAYLRWSIYYAELAKCRNYPSLIIKMIKGERVEENFDGYAKNLLVMKEIKIRTHQL